MIRDGHGGDDLLRIQEDRERALDRDQRLDFRAGLVDAGDALGQPRIVRIGLEQIIVARRHAHPNRLRPGGSGNPPVSCFIFSCMTLSDFFLASA